MSEGKLSEQMKQVLKRDVGYNDEELEIIENNPKLSGVVRAIPSLFGKKLVVTCVQAEHCTYNKVGDRYVFSAFGGMIKDETCKAPCLWALGAMYPVCYMVYDRAASGLDPGGMHLDHVRCPDTGCRFGGFGTATFKITVEDA